MTDELVHYDVSDAIATITLDSPRNKNALSNQLQAELAERFERAEGDDDVKVVLLRSADRVFCSGADLGEAHRDGMAAGSRKLVAMQRRIVALDKPVVVRLDGPVRAGGIGIVAAADIVIAAEAANFALTEVKLGLAPAAISLTVLRRMGSRAAALTALGGEVFGAAEAAAYGLVTAVADDVEAETAAICASLATGTTQGLRESKRLLNADLLRHIDEHGEAMAELSATLFGSEPAREAMAAFLNRKR